MDERSKDGNVKITEKAVALPFERHVPETITTQYANHFVIQAPTGEDFYLSFFEAVPPDTIDMPEDQIREKIKSIRATCIARIVVSRDLAARIVTAIQSTLGKAQARKNQEGLEVPEDEK